MVRGLVVFTFVAAFAVFCVVQDRITASGAKEFGVQAVAAIARHQPVTPVDEVMRPAIRRSVRMGFASAGAVLGVGLGAAVVLRRSADRG